MLANSDGTLAIQCTVIIVTIGATVYMVLTALSLGVSTTTKLMVG